MTGNHAALLQAVQIRTKAGDSTSKALIMSNLPTSTRAVIEVDIPHPRNIEDIADNERANEIKTEVMTLLHEEAMKSFSGGSKAAADFLEAYTK
jgi:NitT/TauT family transport system ATP-binding protein